MFLPRIVSAGLRLIQWVKLSPLNFEQLGPDHLFCNVIFLFDRARFENSINIYTDRVTPFFNKSGSVSVCLTINRQQIFPSPGFNKCTL